MTDSQQQLPQGAPRHPANQPLSAGVYSGLAFAALIITGLIAYAMYFAGAQFSSQPVMRSLYYLLLCVLGITSALFLFGVLKSTASISGKQYNTVVDVGGPAALAVLVVAGGYVFGKLPDKFTLTVRLQGPQPIAQLAADAGLWVDLKGRREHKMFNADAEVVVKEIPSEFSSDPIQLIFESPRFRLDGNKDNTLSVQMPTSQVVVLKVVPLDASELRRRALGEKYQRILEQISLELSRKRAFLFPAIDAYLASPNDVEWIRVRLAAADSQRRITEQMDMEVEFQAQEDLIKLASKTGAMLGDVPIATTPRDRPPSFNNALGIHNQRVGTLDRIPQGNRPPVDAVKAWADNLDIHYRAMQAELKNLVREFSN